MMTDYPHYNSIITMTEMTSEVVPVADINNSNSNSNSNYSSSYENLPRKRTTSEPCLEEIDPQPSSSSPNDNVTTQRQMTAAIEEVSTEEAPAPQPAPASGDRPRRRLSFIQSLPMAHAEPELFPMMLDNSNTFSTPLIVATDVTLVPTGLCGNGRPSLMSVKVYKDALTTKLGIRFMNTNGRLQISFIAPNSILAETMLKPGDSIIGMDGMHGCSTWSPARAVAYLKDCIGYITLVVRNPLGDPAITQLSVYKAMPNVKLGITLENEKGTGDDRPLRIKQLNPKKLLGDPESLLQVGDYVERINGVVCSKMDKSLAMAIIRECPSLVTIDVKKFPDEEEGGELPNHDNEEEFPEDDFCLQSSFSQLPVSYTEAAAAATSGNDDTHNVVDNNNNNNPVSTTPETIAATEFVSETVPTLVQDHAEPGFVSVTAFKPTKDTKLGLALRNENHGTGDLVIARLSPGKILANSNFHLKPGMKLLSINHRHCKNWDAARTLKLLRESEGVVHLVAQNVKGDSSLVVASAQKSASTTSIGVSFRGSSGRRLKLCDIRANNGGLFGHSVLNVGDTVLAINQISCEQRRPKEAVDIVKQAQDTVTIMARSKASNVVVISHEKRIININQQQQQY